MSNSYFSFKQFTIQQEKTAMKVCTDACVLGAWTANKIEQLKNLPKDILDIGCGTGLLSLMLAQKIPADIDALEIDSAAASQAAENILQSPWKENIHIINTSLQAFTANKEYDLIICNPPFFEDDLRSPDKNKNASKHDTALKLDELAFFIKELLTKNGMATVLIPFHRTEYFSALIKEHQLFINEVLFLKQSPGHKYFRSILLLSHKNIDPTEINELIIHDEERNYTDPFKALLNAYYLKL